jgi:hypothetical protein
MRSDQPESRRYNDGEVRRIFYDYARASMTINEGSAVNTVEPLYSLPINEVQGKQKSKRGLLYDW